MERTITIDLDERARKEAAASRRFPVSVSSENPVPRRDWQTGQTFSEVLSHAVGAVDLSRAPLPVLEGHDRSKVNVGVVTDLRLDSGRLRGTLALGTSARAQELAADIAEGIVRNLSIGYSITVEERDERAKRITARRWIPFEVSIVAIPADTSVGINRSKTMDQEESRTATPSDAPAENRGESDVAVIAERERVNTIRKLVTRYSLGEEFADGLITRGVALPQAREAIFGRLAARDEAFRIENHVRMGEEHAEPIATGVDRADDFRAAAVDSLLLRAGIPVAKPHAAARDVGASVHDLARLSLSRAGKSASRWFGGEARGPKLIERAMTTSDLPAILSATVGAALRHGYEAEGSSHRLWVRVQPVPDLNEQQRVILGSMPDLQPVAEHAEYPNAYPTEDSAKYTVSKMGNIVSVSWEVLINDRLGSFIRTLPALGQAARRAEADAVYATFALNSGAGPAMQDGSNLFVSGHGNLGSSAGFDAALLGAARALLRKMRGVGGGYLALQPRTLLVPAELEQKAEILLADASRSVNTEKATPAWVSQLQLAVEPRLAAGAAYLLADHNQIDHLELGVLEENVGGPTIEEEREFRKDVISWKTRHVFGVKWIDWRGAIRLPTSG